MNECRKRSLTGSAIIYMCVCVYVCVCVGGDFMIVFSHFI